jgi:hypothetical protein
MDSCHTIYSYQCRNLVGDFLDPQVGLRFSLLLERNLRPRKMAESIDFLIALGQGKDFSAMSVYMAYAVTSQDPVP